MTPSEPLHYLSATDALAAFRAKELSPVELLDAVIARAEAVEPTVNALCHTFYDEAREQARAAEARYAGRGEAPRPLEGLPVSIKAEEAIEGHPWTQGSEILRDVVAPYTSEFARRHLAAGAVQRVAALDADRPDLDKDTAGTGDGIGDVLVAQHLRPAVLVDDDGTHGPIV